MKETENHKTPSNKEKQNQPNEYLKYTGLAFQLAGVIGVFTYAGYWLDKKFMDGEPVFLIVFLLLGTFGAIYQLYRGLPK